MAQQPHFWKNKNPISLVLWPLSLVYQLVNRIHLALRARKAYDAGVPVISVGNMNVGGVGKTPLVEALAARFVGEEHHVAILSRGYGGIYQEPHRVTDEDLASEVGDEPKMLHQNLSGQNVSVWVSPNRVDSAKRAVEQGANLLILDDGFQYLSLKRDINLLVCDGTYPGFLGTGNGFTLPAGPLRENKAAIKRADAVILMNAQSNAQQQNISQPMFSLTSILNQKTLQDLLTLQKKEKAPFSILTAIARPEKFETALTKSGLHLGEVFAHPDHHLFTESDLNAATQNTVLPVLTTAKDTVKIPLKWRRKFTTVTLSLEESTLAPLFDWVHDSLNKKS